MSEEYDAFLQEATAEIRANALDLEGDTSSLLGVLDEVLAGTASPDRMQITQIQSYLNLIEEHVETMKTQATALEDMLNEEEE